MPRLAGRTEREAQARYRRAVHGWKERASESELISGFDELSSWLHELMAIVDWCLPPLLARRVHAELGRIQGVDVPQGDPLASAKLGAVLDRLSSLLDLVTEATWLDAWEQDAICHPG